MRASASVPGERLKRPGFAFWAWFEGWFEMVVEGAFGGFVEFLRIGGFVGRGCFGAECFIGHRCKS
jgi:hypothetical protein